jgi:hypothetical protein
MSGQTIVAVELTFGREFRAGCATLANLEPAAVGAATLA